MRLVEKAPPVYTYSRTERTKGGLDNVEGGNCGGTNQSNKVVVQSNENQIGNSGK